MATGDMKNNLMKLLREVRRMKIEVEPDVQGLSAGSPSSFLCLLHAAMMHYSLHLANWYTQHGYDLYGRSDLRFLQELYRVLRDVFNYRPKLTKEQFLSAGFAERKVLMTRDILLFCQAKNLELTNQTTSSSLMAKKRKLPTSKMFGNHGNSTTTVKRPIEVLTIQDRSGVGSAWCESTKNFKVDEPSSSPPAMTPPTFFKLPDSVPAAGSELDVTLPSPPLPLSSSPPRLSSSPTQCSPGQRDTSVENVSINACVVRHDSSHELPPATTSDAEEEREEREDSPPSSTASWTSPPQQQGEEGATLKDSADLPQVVGSKMEQLTKMVENLSAKFMLLETQLKLSQAQEGQRSVEPGIGNSHKPVVEVEEKMVGERKKQPLRDITTEQMARQQRHSPLKQPHPSPMKQPCPSPPREVRSEVDSTRNGATPVSSGSYRRRDFIHQFTTYSLDACLATPTTPEETKRLIESLQMRAKETKEFLQLANSRMLHS